MPSQADLAAAFARMRQNNSEAGAGIRNGAIDLNNIYGNHLGDAPSIPPMPFGASGSSGDSEPLWMKALTGLFAPGKAVTNQFANWTDGKLNLKDIPLVDSIGQGWNEQKSDWFDGKLSWGDVPGFGFLHGVGSQGQGFGKTLTNLGAKPGGYLEKIGGLEGDILFDPLNLVTFGAGSAVKAGAMATSKALLKAEKLGLTGEKAAQFAEDAGKAARNKAQNAVINFDLPGTNITKQFGQKANIPLVGKYLHIADDTIGKTGAVAAKDLFKNAGLTSEQASKILKNNYKVADASELTTQGWKHLQEQIAKLPKDTPDVAKYFTDAEQLFDGAIPNATKNVFDGLPSPGMAGVPAKVGEQSLQDILGGLRLEGDSIQAGAGAGRAAKARNIVDVAEDPLAKLNQFVQDMGGKSALGKAVAKVNPFDARAFRSADVLAKHSANDVRDATTKIHGQTRQANEQIAQVEKAMQGLSDAEQKAVIYTVENAFPKAFDKASVDGAKVQAVAEKIKPILDQIGKRDLASGTVSELRQNYFPHVLKKDGTDLNNFIQDPEIAKILGMSRSNNFGKTREGFQNFAEIEDVVAGLEKAAKADPAKAEALLAKADELRNLFHTDVPSALGYRADKSIRSSAYSELFSKLEKDGLMVRPSTGRSETKVHADSNPQDYKKLTADEAKTLGVEAGTMIHKDTFNGMKQVRELFTVEGANKLLENMNSAVSVWKALVTSYIPAHYYNNFIGNIANNTLAGVKPESYKAASKLLQSMKSGNVSPEDMKIVQAAYDKGVFGAGFDSDFVKSQFKTDKKTLIEKLPLQGYVQWLRKHGNNGDDFARLSLFLHGIKQTGSTDKAAALVRKYLFNYSERSHGDTIARSVAPFWMWTKNNLPLQIQGIMQQPRYYTTYKKIKDAFNGDVEGGQNKPYTTDNYMHLPGTNIGLSTRMLPMNDLGNMFGTGAGDTLRSTLGMASPLLKAPVELALNKQFFNNSPVYHQGEEMQGILNYLKNQTGIVGKAAGLADGQGNPLLELLGTIIGKPVEYK